MRYLHFIYHKLFALCQTFYLLLFSQIILLRKNSKSQVFSEKVIEQKIIFELFIVCTSECFRLKTFFSAFWFHFLLTICWLKGKIRQRKSTGWLAAHNSSCTWSFNVWSTWSAPSPALHRKAFLLKTQRSASPPALGGKDLDGSPEVWRSTLQEATVEIKACRSPTGPCALLHKLHLHTVIVYWDSGSLLTSKTLSPSLTGWYRGTAVKMWDSES